MMIMRAIRSRRYGAWRRTTAILDSGPMGTSVIGSSEAITVSMSRSTAWRGSSSNAGAGGLVPSRPVTPWTDGAVTSSRRSGRSRPAATGMSVTPAAVRTERALRWVSATAAFPATQVTARRSISGLATAMRSAIESSWPGSQSMMIGVGILSSAKNLGRRGHFGLGRRGWSAAAAHAAANVLAARCDSQADDGRRVRNRVGDPAGADAHRLHVRRHALSSAEEDGGHERSNGRAGAERFGCQRDPSLPGGHIAIETGQWTDREVATAQAAEDGANDDRGELRADDIDTNRRRRLRVLTDRPNPETERRVVEQDHARRNHQPGEVAKETLIAEGRAEHRQPVEKRDARVGNRRQIRRLIQPLVAEPVIQQKHCGTAGEEVDGDADDDDIRLEPDADGKEDDRYDD